mgnify:CR=1 FL=1
MTTYYVRQTGNDASAGTSAGAAWRTLGKALGAAGIGSGDTVYIGGGIYREAVTVAMTSPTVETLVVGDVTGQYTGDPGPVVWSTMLLGEWTHATQADLLDLAGRDFLTFQNLVFVPQRSRVVDASGTPGSLNLIFRDCAFFLPVYETTNAVIAFTATADVASNLTIDRCVFSAVSTGVEAITVTLPTSTVADYNANIRITNCEFHGEWGSPPILITTSGADSFRGGGAVVAFNTLLSYANYMVDVVSSSVSAQYPIVLVNNLVSGFLVGSDARSDFAVIEAYNFALHNDYNSIVSNVMYGLSTRLRYAGLASLVGAERITGGRTRGFAGPTPWSEGPAHSLNVEVAVGIPGTFASDNTIVGTAWTNPSNAAINDTTAATASTLLAVVGVSEYLKCTNFSWWNGPSGADEILGIRFEWRYSASATGSIQCNAVKSVKGGVIGGDDLAAHFEGWVTFGNTTWSTPTNTAQYTGNDKALWGQTWTAADITGSGFGVALSAKNIHGTLTRDANVYFVRAVVFYRKATPTVTTDALGRQRPAGGNHFVESGTFSAGGTATATRSGATWGVDQHIGSVCRITGGTGVGQAKVILSNTVDTLTFFSSWATQPDGTSTYVLYRGVPCESFKPSSTSSTVLTRSSAQWTTTAPDQWTGFTMEIVSGTGAGQKRIVTSNAATSITVSPPFVTTPDTTSVVYVYRGTSFDDALLVTPGAFEYHDAAVKETTITDAGGVGWRIDGYGDQRFEVPVDAAATTITIKARYDSNHGTTTKPQAVLLANGVIGVSSQTVTMSAAVDTWETLTIGPFTPTAAGVIIVELRARSSTPYGRAYFDTVTIT